MGDAGHEIGHQQGDDDARTTMRVIANGAGRRANASSMVVTFSIGAPTMNDSRNVVEAPAAHERWRHHRRAARAEWLRQREHRTEERPGEPSALQVCLQIAGSTVSASPDSRMPSIVACQTFSR